MKQEQFSNQKQRMKQQILNLEDLGFNSTLAQYQEEEKYKNFGIGRVISEHKGRYIVKTDKGELDAQLLGSLRFSATSKADFPAVGDWLAISEYDENKAMIHSIYPRKSVIARTDIGIGGERQIIATNIDCGLLVQAVDRDFSINRLERYLTICNAAKVQAIIVLTKIDLITKADLETKIEQISKRIKDVPIAAISNIEQEGIDNLKSLIQKGQTYCLLGSSGVGKSSLINNIAGKECMEVGEINYEVSRGKHTTTHRELIIMENGGIFIDNPGMRMVGMAEVGSGLETTFNLITSLAKTCKFNNCTHIHEEGCAIIEAIEQEALEYGAYENFLKMERENARFERRAAQKAQKALKAQKPKYTKKNRKQNNKDNWNHYN